MLAAALTHSPAALLLPLPNRAQRKAAAATVHIKISGKWYDAYPPGKHQLSVHDVSPEPMRAEDERPSSTRTSYDSSSSVGA